MYMAGIEDRDYKEDKVECNRRTLKSVLTRERFLAQGGRRSTVTT